MSDGTYNRPQRLFDPRGQDQRGQDSRAQDRRGPTSDPLLELARLIGQSDPFAPVRGRATDAPHGGFDSQTGDRAPVDRAPADRPPFIRPPSRDYAPSQDQSFQDRSFQDRPYGDHPAQDRYEPDFGRRDAQPAPPPRFPLRPEPPSAPHFAPDNAVFARLSERDAYPVAPQQAPAADEAGGDHYADPQAAQYDPAHGQHGDYAGEYESTEYDPEGEYEYEAEPEEAHQGDRPPGLKRRNTTKVVIAVLGLAVFGSAAAFGYRTMFKAGPSGPPPVIRADTSPTKVMPAGGDRQPEADQRTARRRYGRTRGAPRRRSGRPFARATASGVMGSGGGYQGGAGFSSSAAPPSGPASLTEPKKVRTVTIRADQGSPAPAAPASRQRAASARRPRRRRTALRWRSRRSARRPARPRRRPRPVPAIAAVGGGGYVVQLSAQKSEADAQAAFRAAQAKYAVLSGRQPLIRRKDRATRRILRRPGRPVRRQGRRRAAVRHPQIRRRKLLRLPELTASLTAGAACPCGGARLKPPPWRRGLSSPDWRAPTIAPDERAFLREASPVGPHPVQAQHRRSDPTALRLIDDFRAVCGRDAAVLIDQEGGRVQRLGPPHWPAYPAGARLWRALPARSGARPARGAARAPG